ncbi:MAG TPA: hypothetical protein VHP32_06385 [Ignavibacteria bacterium]|nr:hypothetical protein [Ignavibacteria bacterium]
MHSRKTKNVAGINFSNGSLAVNPEIFLLKELLNFEGTIIEIGQFFMTKIVKFVRNAIIFNNFY